ncbi:MAG: hypothetical protein WCJ56_01040 [bacterium]
MNEIIQDETISLHKYDWALRSIIYGLCGFFICLVFSVVRLPEGITANRGFSYYGDYAETYLFFRIAFLSVGASMLLASFYLPRVKPFQAMRVSFWIMFVLLCGVAFTTVPGTTKFHIMHKCFGIPLFIFQFVFGTWLALKISKTRANVVFFLVLLVGDICSLLGLLYQHDAYGGLYPLFPYLLHSQILFQAAFSAILLYTLYRLRGSVVSKLD